MNFRDILMASACGGGGGPALSLDFLSGALDSRITFTRGSNATLTDSTGKVTYAPTNLVTYSQEFDNAAWTKNQGGVGIVPVVTANAGDAPDGTSTADRVQFSLGGGTTTGDVSDLRQAPTTAAARHIFSFWVKSFDGASTYNMLARDANGIINQVAVTGNWTRYSIAASYNAGTSTVGLGLRGGQTPTNNNTADVLVWGAQLEPVTYQTTPGTYVATTSSAYYGPRFDYDPVTLAPKGLLIEEARTNLLTYSEQFDNAAWTKIAMTATPNATVSPDGTTTADTMSTGGGAPGLAYTTQTPAATTGAISFFAKANTARYFIVVHGTYASGDYAVFDLQSGAITQQPTYAGTTAQVVNVGSGWFRCILNSAQSTAVVGFSISGAATGTATGTSGTIYIWGAQLEAGAFATSYIPTVASTVTRSADIATMTGTNFSSWYNQSAGTFVVRADDPAVSSAANIFTVDDTTTQERVRLLTDVADPKMIVTDGNVTQANLDAGAISAGTAFRFAGAYKLNDFAVSVNGGAAVTDAVGTIPTVTTARLGADSVGNYLNGHIRQIAYFNTRLPDAQLQALTA